MDTEKGDLITAARAGHTKTVKALFEAAADIQVKNNNGEKALMVSEKSGHTNIVQLLRKAEANK